MAGVVPEAEEKKRGLVLLMEHCTGKRGWRADAEFRDINELARMMDFSLARGKLAAEPGKQRRMAEYRFLPYRGENVPEDYARKKLGPDVSLPRHHT